LHSHTMETHHQLDDKALKQLTEVLSNALFANLRLMVFPNGREVDWSYPLIP